MLLGLGLATLVPLHGGAAVEVSDTPGVRVAGILLQAGPVTSRALITVGVDPAATLPHYQNPIVLSDVYARVGGPGVDPETGLGEPVSASVMMEVNASHAILDNVWLCKKPRKPAALLFIDHFLALMCTWVIRNVRVFFQGGLMSGTASAAATATTAWL